MALPTDWRDRLALPVIAGPLFIVSTPELVLAQCKAGIVGALPTLNARPHPLLDDWLAQIKQGLESYDRSRPERLAAPFAVNIFVHATNARLEHDLDLCVRYQVPIVITSFASRPDINEAVQAYGGITLHDVTSDRFARKAIERGASGLVALCAGAGGQGGALSPFALIEEIRSWYSGLLGVGGGIATGRGVIAAQAAGADFAYIGTPFIATHEANASAAYKAMVVGCSADDVIRTNFLTGVDACFLRPSLVAAGLDPDDLPLHDAGGFKIGEQGANTTAWRDIWSCGHGVGSVHSVQSVADLVANLAHEYCMAAEDLAPILSKIRQ